MKLTTQLTVLLVLVAIVPVLLVGMLSYNSAQDALEQDAINRLGSITLLKAAEFERWLEDNRRALRELAQRPLVQAYAGLLLAEDVTPAATQDLHDALLTNHLQPILAEERGYLLLSLLDPVDGRVVVSTDPALEGKFREHTQYFLEGQHDTFVQHATYSLARREVVMYISTPVRDEDGNLLAVLTGHADLDEVAAIMAQGRILTKTEETYLVNRSNFMLNPSRFESSSGFQISVRTPGVEACLAGETGHGLYADYRGVPVVGSYRWLAAHELCIVTEIDQDEAFQPSTDLRETVALIGLVVGLIVVLPAILFARTLTRPLGRLSEAAHRFGAGQLDARVNMQRRDELGLVARSFDQMAADLSASDRALRDQEAQYRTLIESADAAISSFDAEGRCLFANTHAAREMGSTPEALKGIMLTEAFPPEYAQGQYEHIHRVITSGQGTVEEVETEIGGKTRWYRTSIQPLRDAVGNINSALVIANDITARVVAERVVLQLNETLEQRIRERTAQLTAEVFERQRAEQALRESEALFRGYFEHAQIGLAITSPEKQWIQVNDRLCEMLGYEQAELKALTWADVTYPDDLAADVALFDQVMAGKMDHYLMEKRYVRSDQVIVYVSLTASCLRKEDGQVTYFLASLQDISDRVLAEQRLAEQNEDLARSNAELQQFAYVASHDLQEPLRMVTSYLQLIQRRYGEQLDADADEFIGYAVDGANRMKALINDLLTYSRVGTRGKPFEPTDTSTVLAEVLQDLQPAVEECQAHITHDDLPVVFADPVQMHQLFQNLLSNAIKFHSERPLTIHVGCVRTPNAWQFSVRDNGIGIDPAYNERIFVIFQRLHARTEYPGTGIGLAICKKIVERHGGRIWFEPEIGQGTVFYFTIPV